MFKETSVKSFPERVGQDSDSRSPPSPEQDRATWGHVCTYQPSGEHWGPTPLRHLSTRSSVAAREHRRAPSGGETGAVHTLWPHPRGLPAAFCHPICLFLAEVTEGSPTPPPSREDL